MDNTNKKAPAATEAKENVHPHCASLGDLVQANIDGQRAASEFILGLRGRYADPDALYFLMSPALQQSHDMVTLAKLRGMCRVIQKQLERGAA